MKLLPFAPVCLLIVIGLHPATAADPAGIVISAPKPYQVVQRSGFDPVLAAQQEPGGAAFGFANICLRAAIAPGGELAACEYRVVPLHSASDRGTEWTRVNARALAIGKGVFEATAHVAAGGWYRLEIRCRKNDEVIAQGAVEPVGVGEVFLVAGQSYATNCNDERLKVTDPQSRVVAYDSAKDSWSVANDPQPAPDGSDGGSIWPPLGDALLNEFRVPIGFANVAVGATSSAQWMPEGALYARMVKTGQALGRFRGVLWQQGESDVIAKTSTETYVANLKAIRQSAAKSWAFEPPWYLAKSTLHPTVYTDPDGEARIRLAIDELIKLPGFRAGPDTDKLAGDNRGDAKSRRHFSAIGQRRAADMWFAVLKERLRTPPSAQEALHALLPELKLLEPVWSAPVVHRESSVVLQLKPDGPLTARLAFPAAEVLKIEAADRKHRFDVARDALLSDDGLTLTFAPSDHLQPIRADEFFPPKDAPNSYRHRTGRPEQNLLYRPGRWFHDHNLEITYRRRETDEKALPAELSSKTPSQTLPRTLARLRAGEPLTLGISGDSISTGADASAIAKAPPFQPGFAELVAAELQTTFGGEVTLKNRAVGGWSVANGLQDLDKLLAEKPHLILIAYGMNDVGRRDPAWFGQQTKAILQRIRESDPEAEVILVSSMLGHAEWVHTPREMFTKYRDELQKLTGPGVALADVTALWQLLLQNKHDLDLTGNGLNHPNDFGHRLYAQSILALLAEPARY
jgi:lysophospholipase L1-like esterase